MAYKTGVVGSSHQLAHIVHAMMRDEGWSLHKSLHEDGADSVFYSSGSSGNYDIYVRVAAGMFDFNIVGDVQMPKEDGYNGYLNLLVYQSWDAAQIGVAGGNNEIGRTGPVLYTMSGSTNMNDFYEYNLLTSTSVNSVYRIMSRKLPWYLDDNKVFGAWDGHSKSFHEAGSQDLGGTSTSQLYQIDYRRGYPNRAIWHSTYNNMVDDFLALTVRRANDEILIYYPAQFGNDIEYQWCVFNQDNFDDYRNRFFSPSPYSAANTVDPNLIPGGFIARGPSRTQKDDGFIYMGELDSGQWFAYGITKDSWDIFQPFTDSLVQLPSAADDGKGIVVTKEVTGYDNDRLYVIPANVTGGGAFYSIALNDNGRPLGSWITHTALGFAVYYTSGLFILGGYLMFSPGSNTNAAGLYKWKFPVNPEGAGIWETVNSSFFALAGTNGSAINLHHSLSSRVRTREKEANTYWAFVDQDRVVVVTKTNGTGLNSDDRYHYAYAGLFKTYYDNSVTVLTQSASVGNTALSVIDPTIFKIDEIYVIVDVSGTRQTLLDVADNEYFMAPSFSFTVSDLNISGGTVTINPPLPYDFPAGSKLGKDPQPVGVRREKVDQFYVLNNINSSDTHLSKDTAWQWYNLREMHQSDPNHGDKSFDKFVSHNMTSSLKENARTGETNVSPAIIYLGESDGYWDAPKDVEREIRGEMIGVYFCGNNFKNETKIVIDDSTYVVFGIYESDLTKIAVGPIEE